MAAQFLQEVLRNAHADMDELRTHAVTLYRFSGAPTLHLARRCLTHPDALQLIPTPLPLAIVGLDAAVLCPMCASPQAIAQHLHVGPVTLGELADAGSRLEALGRGWSPPPLRFTWRWVDYAAELGAAAMPFIWRGGVFAAEVARAQAMLRTVAHWQESGRRRATVERFAARHAAAANPTPSMRAHPELLAAWRSALPSQEAVPASLAAEWHATAKQYATYATYATHSASRTPSVVAVLVPTWPPAPDGLWAHDVLRGWFVPPPALVPRAVQLPRTAPLPREPLVATVSPTGYDFVAFLAAEASWSCTQVAVPTGVDARTLQTVVTEFYADGMDAQSAVAAAALCVQKPGVPQ